MYSKRKTNNKILSVLDTSVHFYISTVIGRRSSVTFLLILFACLHVFGQSETAIKLYDQQKYHEAWKEWNQLISQGAKGEKLYYNIANTYYKLQEYPKAILFYNKALKWNPNCSDCKKNLLLTQKTAGIESFELPKFILSKWYDAVLLSLQPLYWLITGIIFLSIMISLMIFKYQDFRKRFPLPFYFIAIVSLICFAFAFHRDQIKHSADEVILMQASGLHISPDTSSEIKVELIPGQLLIMKDHISGWIKVQTKEFDLGWVEANKVELVGL
jgi:hypothetical protein